MTDRPLVFEWDQANLGHIAQHNVRLMKPNGFFLETLSILKCNSPTRAMERSGSSSLERRRRAGFCNGSRHGAAERYE
jgi:hypothetical protein